MIFRLICLASLLLSQSVLAFGFKSHPKSKPYQSIQKNEAVSKYTEILVNGNIDLRLRTGFSKSGVFLRGDKRDLDFVKFLVKDGALTLHVANGHPKYGPLSAELRTRYLNGFEYHGKGAISGHKLRANLVDLFIDNAGKTSLKGTIRLNRLRVIGKGETEINGVVSPMLHVKLSDAARLKLSGMARIRTIDMEGDSWFSLLWVKSTSMRVRLRDNAFLQLAGIANKVDAKVAGHARFNARYLRARRAFVKTCDNAVAEIVATRHQHTLATDSSDIRFYKLPKMKTDFMALDGSILDMRALNSPLVEEPTIYNKGVAQG